MALFLCSWIAARPVSRLKRVYVCAHEVEETTKREKRETHAELAKGRAEREKRKTKMVQRADTVVKEPSSSLHLDTHKYKAQPFELPRRVSSFRLSPTLDVVSSSLLVAPALRLTRLRSLPRWQSKFISRSCLFWTFHNIWPCFGIQHRSRRAPVTRRYGFEPSVMDGSLSSRPRIAASLLSCYPSFALRLRPSFFIHPGSFLFLAPLNPLPGSSSLCIEDARPPLMGSRAGQS